MPYVDLAGLSRFAGKSKDFASSACAGLDMANWQRTAAAGAVSFSPVPEMPIDPVVNFMFTETWPASGTKGPDNPSTITGVTQAKVTRCGKNVLAFPYPDTTKTDSGITWTVNNDGSVTASGTAESTVFFYFSFSNNTHTNSGMQYTLSGCPSGGSSSTYALRYGTSGYETGSGYTFTASDNLGVIARIASGTVLSTPITFKPQLELGSTATSFEPYEGADYTVNLGGTFYGGSVDLSTGVMTVTHGGLVFDGTEHDYWHTGGELGSSGIYRYGFYPLTPSGPTHSSTTQACTHLPYEYNYYSETEHFYVGTSLSIFIKISTLEAFKSWLAEQYSAGHPLSVVYDYSTPLTVQLTPTQIYSLSQPDSYAPRINTVYSDQVSVQVGYPKSPQATQNELTNAIVSLGGNV